MNGHKVRRRQILSENYLERLISSLTTAMVVVSSSDSKAELKADDVVFVKAVALQGVCHDDRLLNGLEVCEAKVNFKPVLGLSGNQA